MACGCLFSARQLANSLDRKSTRLNSSHVEISYAVFCLKKKTPSAPHFRFSRSAPSRADQISLRPPLPPLCLQTPPSAPLHPTSLPCPDAPDPASAIPPPAPISKSAAHHSTASEFPSTR